MSLRPAIAKRFRSLWFSSALTLVLACLSGNSFALGLGEIQVNSVINEPLSATIPVLNAGSVEQAELIVALGSAADYLAAEVTWDFSHSELQFEVGYAPNGDLRINVTSNRSIREPYLNFIVQARWPAGRLLREYTVLLDFPVFTGERQTAPTVAAAPAAAAAASPRPTPAATPSAPAPVQAVAATPATPTNANVAPRLVSGAPTSAASRSVADGEYRIQNGDTLWSLGGRVAQDLGVSRHQAMLAIREANPDAFVQGNLNMLRSGSVIRTPSRNAALSRTATQAAAEFAQAMAASGQIQAGSTPLQSRVTDFRNEGNAGQAATGQFRLASGQEVDAGTAGNGLDQIVSENQALSDLNAALQEQLRAAEIQNQDLTERMQNLEEQSRIREALAEVENNAIRNVQEAVTVNPITTVVVEERGLVQKVLSWLPILGILVIGLLVGAYLLIRRRQSEAGTSQMASFDAEDYKEDSASAEEESDLDDATAASMSAAGAELEEEDFGDLLTANEESDSMEDEADDESGPIENESDSESAASSKDEDWGSDFDDLDAFFSDPDEVVPGKAEQPAKEEIESDLDKTQIFDTSILSPATGAVEDEAENADAGMDNLDAGLDDDTEISFDEAEDDSGFELDAEAAEESDDENVLDFSFDADEADEDDSEEDSEVEFDAAEETKTDSQGDESSLDFNMDDDEPEIKAVPETVQKEEEEDVEEDGNSLNFDVSDLDLGEEDGDKDESSSEADAETEDEIDEGDENDFSAFGLDDESENDGESTEDDDEVDFTAFGLDDDSESSEEADGDDESMLDQLDTLLEELDEDEDEDEDEDPEEESLEDDDSDLEDLTAFLDSDATETDEEPKAVEATGADEDLLNDFSDDDLGFDLDEVDDSGFGDAEEFETKLELAAAYIEMGDASGAKELLEEVLREGDDTHKERATELLDKIG